MRSEETDDRWTDRSAIGGLVVIGLLLVGCLVAVVVGIAEGSPGRDALVCVRSGGRVQAVAPSGTNLCVAGKIGG